jgi:hypothetical protein
MTYLFLTLETIAQWVLGYVCVCEREKFMRFSSCISFV